MRRDASVPIVRNLSHFWPLAVLPLALGSLSAASQEPQNFFDQESFRLIKTASGFLLRADGQADLVVPIEWLEPPAVVEEEKETYVSSLNWDEIVTSFPIGAGELGLHLSSYEIQEQGSAQAAAGRDLILRLDPANGSLHLGLDLGLSKGRGRSAGCFRAHSHRIIVGDINCDGRLDIGVLDERLGCELDDNLVPTRKYHRVGPRRWHVAEGNAWVHHPSHDEGLPCEGLRELPFIGMVKSPVDFILEGYQTQAPLRDPPGRP